MAQAVAHHPGDDGLAATELPVNAKANQITEAGSRLRRAVGLAAVVLAMSACDAGGPPTREVPPAGSSATTSSDTSTSTTAEPATTGGGSAGCGPSQASDPVTPGSSARATDLPPVDPSTGVTGVEEGETPPESTSC